VVVNGIWDFHLLAAYLAVRGTATPFLVFPHGMLDPWFRRRYPLKHLKKWLFWPWAMYLPPAPGRCRVLHLRPGAAPRPPILLAIRLP
jgi:hypothetical protein